MSIVFFFGARVGMVLVVGRLGKGRAVMISGCAAVRQFAKVFYVGKFSEAYHHLQR